MNFRTFHSLAGAGTKMATPIPFRLTIAPELAPFGAEIDHVCALLREAHGLVRSDEAAAWLHYGSNPPPGSIGLPAALFPDCIIQGPDGLHLDRTALSRQWQNLAPQDDARQFDALGLIFLLVSRIEERDTQRTDRYGRYRCEDDIQVQHGLYGRAAADEAMAALARLVTGAANPPSATTYRVLVTHDVDRLKAYHRPIEPLRLAAGDLLKRRRPVGALKRLGAYFSAEPWESVNDLLALSERHGYQSQFYFMGPSNEPFDSPYVLAMAPLLRRVSDRIAERGHAIGFHPCSGTATDAQLWQSQRDRLEAVLGRPVREGRQHGLLYRADTTPDIWDGAGMTADYTLAYPERDGFRSGSTRALPAYSLRRRRTLGLRQASTAVMEFGMFGGKYRDLTVEEALVSCRPLLQACRRHGGTFVVLYHTGPQPPKARAFYEALLSEAA